MKRYINYFTGQNGNLMEDGKTYKGTSDDIEELKYQAYVRAKKEKWIITWHIYDTIITTIL
jgi:hypothetical protein